MMKQSPAKIVLRKWQFISENEVSRTLHVVQENQHEWNHLQFFKDETLAAKTSKNINQEVEYLCLLPVVGNLEIAYSGMQERVKCGELFLLHHPNSPVSIRNNYENDLINFFLIGFKNLEIQEKESAKIYPFQLNYKKELQILIKSDTLKIAAGQFQMREERTYKPVKKETQTLFFVIQGSFEIQGRMLYSRDGLTLSNIDSVDIESFGDESILFIIETN